MELIEMRKTRVSVHPSNAAHALCSMDHHLWLVDEASARTTLGKPRTTSSRRTETMHTIVIALGGNALIEAKDDGGHDGQMKKASVLAEEIGHLIGRGHRIVLTHGNGPHVGNLAIQQAAATGIAPQPLFVLVAMSQGQIGSLMCQALGAALPSHRDRVVSVITHSVVSEDDPAFENPTKPIGPFLDAEGLRHASSMGWDVGEDAGRGTRRMVPSPRPSAIVEAGAIRRLVESGHVVIAGGGGGIPVADARQGGGGIDAVIDKDRTAVEIGHHVGADLLALITNVDNVMLDYGTSNERPIETITPADARKHLDDGQFAAGSMGPKIEAAIDFLERGGTRAIITSSSRLTSAIDGRVGTQIAPT